MDKYYVYRPLLDLIGFTEGTDKGEGYNETLAYGKMLDGVKTRGGGPSVNLVGMTLTSIDALQTKMLKDPDNSKLNSSAIGRYQIVRTTLRKIKKALNLTGSELFDADMQDRMCCYLLYGRGIDSYLAGKLSEDTLINNLAKEWASLPTTKDKGYYAGQHTPITSARVRQVLKAVKQRKNQNYTSTPEPKPIPVTKPTVSWQDEPKLSWWDKIKILFGVKP